MKNIFAALILSCSIAHSATYYLDSGASGANDGASWADAFETWPDAISGIGDGTGDTLYVSGGSTTKIYDISAEYPMTLPGGSTGNPFTITAGIDSGHDGIAVIDAGQQSNSGNYCFDVANDFITINGQSGSDGERHLVFANFVDYVPDGRSAGRMFYAEGLDEFDANFITISNVSTGMRFISSTDDIEIHNSAFLQIRGDAAFNSFAGLDAWDGTLFHSNVVEVIKSSAVPDGASGSWGGPDHFQIGRGSSVYGNILTIKRDQLLYTSTQHPDVFQVQGSKIKIHANDITDTGDAIFTLGGALTANIADVRIYNNVVRMTDETMTPFPEVLRVYGHASTPIDSLQRVYFVNNTVIDFDVYNVVRFDRFETVTSPIDDIRLQNNLFYNSGVSSSQRLIYIATGDATFDAADWLISNNVYYHPSSPDYIRIAGTNYTAVEFIADYDTDGLSSAPTFEYYVEYSELNTGRISAVDTIARGNGVDLGSVLGESVDIDGDTRIGAWDIGADQFAAGGTLIDFGTGTFDTITISK